MYKTQSRNIPPQNDYRIWKNSCVTNLKFRTGFQFCFQQKFRFHVETFQGIFGRTSCLYFRADEYKSNRTQFKSSSKFNIFVWKKVNIFKFIQEIFLPIDIHVCSISPIFFVSSICFLKNEFEI